MDALPTTVVIPTLNRPAELARLLDTLAQQEQPPQALIVADQSGAEAFEKNSAALAAFAARGGVVGQHLACPVRSLTHARNRALAQVTTPVATFLDDDVEVGPAYLRESEAFFATHRCVLLGGVPWAHWPPTSRTLGNFGRAERLHRRCFGLALPGARFRLKENLEAEYPGTLAGPMPTEVVSGSNFTVRTDVAHAVGWDERLRGYALAEDVDFSYRVAQRHPGAVWLHPDLPIAHRPAPAQRLQAEQRLRMHACHHLYLFFKFRRATPGSVARFAWSRLGHALLPLVQNLRWGWFPRPRLALLGLRAEALAWRRVRLVRQGNFSGLLPHLTAENPDGAAA